MAKPRKTTAPSGADIGALCLDLAKIGCTQSEIAAVAGCSVDTIQRNFSEQFETGKELCKKSLRRMQWDKAESGQVAMLIWLGKQILGQREKVELSDGGSVAQHHADAIMRRKAERLARQAVEQKAVEAPN